MKVRIAVFRIKGVDDWQCSVCHAVVKGEIVKDDEDNGTEYGYKDTVWNSGGCTMCGALPPPDPGDC